ncbi:unnamed protein product [Clonostachys rhizophaga]|uniref:Uncharacterized protein n=1 Tax=Clonostachys rhizophaga TaxID=160324 RepID=A0A9N9VKN2_9HYPO|nr:unnamed protein product [Clonostachys rhizophaga]
MLPWIGSHFLVRWFYDTMITSKAKNPNPEALVEAMRKGYKSLKGIDADLHKDDQLMKKIAGSARAAFAGGSEGYVTDATILTRPWGFDLGAAEAAKVAMWYGDKDTTTPSGCGKGCAGAHWWLEADCS